MKAKRTWGVLLFALLLWNGCSSDSDSYTQGVWKRRSDVDGAARCCANSFTIGNKGYLCCGYNNGTKYYKDLWVYDIENDYWASCAPMPDEASARHDAVSFALNGKGYVTTGYYKTTSTYLKDTWQYDPETDEWTRMDDFPGTARFGAIGFSVNGYAYVGMGKDEDNYMKDIYRFDPTAPSGSQWQVVNGYGGTKRVYGSCFVIDDVAYIFGGINNGVYEDDFWKFDGTTWKQLRDISDSDDDEDYDDDYGNIRRQRAVTFVIDGKGYLATGTGSGGSYMSDYWVYYPETDLWYGDSDDEYTPFEGSTREAAVSFSTGTRGFILTGRSGSTSAFDDVWELFPYELEDY